MGIKRYGVAGAAGVRDAASEEREEARAATGACSATTAATSAADVLLACRAVTAVWMEASEALAEATEAAMGASASVMADIKIRRWWFKASFSLTSNSTRSSRVSGNMKGRLVKVSDFRRGGGAANSVFTVRSACTKIGVLAVY